MNRYLVVFLVSSLLLIGSLVTYYSCPRVEYADYNEYIHSQLANVKTKLQSENITVRDGEILDFSYITINQLSIWITYVHIYTNGRVYLDVNEGTFTSARFWFKYPDTNTYVVYQVGS